MRKWRWRVLYLLLSFGLVPSAFAGAEPVIDYWLLVDSSRVGKKTNPDGAIRYSPFAVRELLKIKGIFQDTQKFELPYSNQQHTTNNIQPSSSPPRFSLKNGTLSLLDPYAPSFNVAAEHIILPRLYGHLEAGPLINARIFREPTIDNLKGYRLRGAVRYYLRPPEIGDYAPFIELMYTNQYTDVDIEGDFRRNTSVGQYRQRLTYHMEQRKQGGYFNMGLQQVYAGGFIFEFGAGLGISRKREDFSGVPPDARFRTNGGLGWEYKTFDDATNLADVQLYINLGYVIR